MPIVVKDLSFNYMPDMPHSRPTLSGVSVTINDGDFIGVIGHTGSGKSTFIQQLNGLLLPGRGSVLVNGLDTADKAQRAQIRRQVGMVFQYPEYQLFEESVEKDIAFGPKNMGKKPEEIPGLVKDAMAAVGLDYDEFSQRSPFELSGGQKRRVAIAGVIAVKPQVLVLDEPMAGLDPAGRQDMLSLVKSLHQGGMTVVMVSHSMDDIAACCNRVLVFNKGEVIACAPPEEVFSDPGRLIKIGLDVPRAAAFAQRLRDGGLKLDKGIYLMPQLCGALKELWQNGK